MVKDTHPDENFYCKLGPLGWTVYDDGVAVAALASVENAKCWVMDYFDTAQEHLQPGETVELSCAIYNEKGVMLDLITSEDVT